MVITHQKSMLDTHTEKREKNPNVTLRIVIKSQEKRTKEEGKKRTYENKPKSINKMALRTYILIITLTIKG